MAQITKREILNEGSVIHTITQPPFDKFRATGLLLPGTHTLTERTYIDGSQTHASESQVTVTITAAAPSGLVSEYNFNETTGDLIDSVGGYNGTIYGNPTRDGSTYFFDADGKYIQIADNNDHSFVDANGDVPFRIRTRISTQFLDRNEWIISRRDNFNSGIQEWQAIILNGNIEIWLFDSSGDAIIASTPVSALTVNTIYDLDFTYDGSGLASGLKIYINGVNTNATTSGTYNGMSDTTSKTVLGRFESTGGFSFRGRYDQVDIYRDVVFSDQDITNDYS